jgi:DNA-binding transcriptional LysR family regulator
MNIQDLTIFIAAARLGSFTGTAKALATVQSNVTARVQLLEEDLGVSLFRRSHRGIQLTPKGEEFLPYAQQVLALIQKAREQVSHGGNPGGRLRIGSLGSIAAARLPEILKDYAAKYQRVDLAVETGMSGELIEKLLDYRLDAAFVSSGADHPGLHAQLAFTEEVVVLTPPEYKTVPHFLRHGPVPKVLVFRSGCSYRQKLEHFLFEAGFPQLDEMEFGTFDGIIGCVGAGLGIAMLPRSVVERSLRRDEIRVHSLPKGENRMDVFFVTRKDEAPTAALERLREIITPTRAATP